MRSYGNSWEEDFWDRKAGCDDLTNLNLRWLSVLFIILAFGELLDCPQPCSVEAQRECEDSSLHFYWSARKSLVIAPSFYGESPDLTRAGILITRYLIYTKRVSESWLTGSFAVRMAQAQGMHIDGEHLQLPRKVIEVRRRLWGQLYFLDISIALALGRPNSINENHCVFKEMDNIWVDDMSNEEAASAQPLDLEANPTPSALLIFQHRLSRIITRIHDMQFSLASTTGSSASYDEKSCRLKIFFNYGETHCPLTSNWMQTCAWMDNTPSCAGIAIICIQHSTLLG
ncbi:hypothetical protein KCU65_g3744, partial [Aureobasidium melanogenum]